jgi:hypothetical protein
VHGRPAGLDLLDHVGGGTLKHERSAGTKWAAIAFVVLSLVPMRRTATAVVYCVLGALLCLGAGLALARLPGAETLRGRLAAGAARVGSAIARPRPAAFGAALWGVSFLVTAASTAFVLERTPGAFDGVMYLFQAKIFASGHVTATAPALPDFFRTPFAIFDAGKWYSQYPPGFPALLSLGVALGAAWLVNPALIGLHAVLVHRLAREIASESEARGAGILAGLSPFAVFLGSDYMSNAASLLFATAFMLGVVRFVRGGSPWAVALAGAAGGLGFTVRPYSAVGICFVFALVCAATLVRRRAWRAALAGALGAAPPLVAFALYNLAKTGDPLLLGYTKLHGANQAPAAGIADWTLGDYGYLVRNALQNLNGLNKDLFQLPVPGLALAALPFVLRRPTRWELALGLSFASLVGFYSIYYYASFYLGPRFLFEGLGALAILAATGLATLFRRLREAALGDDTRRALWIAAALAALVAFPTAVGLRVRTVHRGYSDPTILEAVADRGLQRAIVFVAEKQEGPRWIACAAANTPALDGEVLYARDLGPENAKLLALHPGRNGYRWDGKQLVELR